MFSPALLLSQNFTYINNNGFYFPQLKMERCFKVVNVREGLSCIVISPLFKRTKCRLVSYSEFNIFPALYYGDSAEKENKEKNEKKKQE